MIYEYSCEKCGKVQEKWHKLAEKNEEPCEKCEAPAEELVLKLPAVTRHISWGKWRVGGC